MIRQFGFATALGLLLAGCGESGSAAADPAPAAEAGAGGAVAEANQALAGEQLQLTLASSVQRLCSAVYVSGRRLEHVLAEELEEAAAQGLHFELGDDPPAAIGSAAGASALSVFRPNLGCTLVAPGDVQALLGQVDPAAFPAAVEPDPGLPWPEGARVELPESVDGLDLTAVKGAVDEAFLEPDPDNLRRTRAVVVVHRGRIVAERYAAPFGPDTPQLGWSMTKTATNALTGLLVKDGVLAVDAPAPVPAWQAEGDARQQIMLGQLLQMSSGLDFAEVYALDRPSDVVEMLFGRGAYDVGAFAADKPLVHPPGTHWSYSSGTSNVISRLHRQAFDDPGEYLAFPRERLFNALGMASAVIEPDFSGTFVGSSYMYATPRDWARLGLLYLQDGVWNGTRNLPEGWVEYSLQPAPAAPNGRYGAQIWLNRGTDAEGADRPRPELPAETYYLSGFEGQNVVVVPSAELVVVRMGLTRSGESPVWGLTARILDAAN